MTAFDGQLTMLDMCVRGSLKKELRRLGEGLWFCWVFIRGYHVIKNVRSMQKGREREREREDMICLAHLNADVLHLARVPLEKVDRKPNSVHLTV